MKFALFLLAFLALGCERYSNSYEVHVSPDFPPDQLATVDDVLVEWEQRAGVILSVIMANERCEERDCFTIVPATGEEISTRAGHPVLGLTIRDRWTDESRILIASDSLSGSSLFGPAVGHEVGHALGLNHENGYALMNPTLGAGALFVTCADVAQYDELRGYEDHQVPATPSAPEPCL